MHADGGADALLDIAVERLDGLVQLERGADGAHGVIFVCDGIAEDGHYGIAEELVDPPVIAGDDFVRP